MNFQYNSKQWKNVISNLKCFQILCKTKTKLKSKGKKQTIRLVNILNNVIK